MTFIENNSAGRIISLLGCAFHYTNEVGSPGKRSEHAQHFKELLEQLDQGSDALSLFVWHNSNGTSRKCNLLLELIKLGSLDLVKLVFQRFPDVNVSTIKDSQGRSILHWAVQRRHYEVLLYLLRQTSVCVPDVLNCMDHLLNRTPIFNLVSSKSFCAMVCNGLYIDTLTPAEDSKLKVEVLLSMLQASDVNLKCGWNKENLLNYLIARNTPQPLLELLLAPEFSYNINLRSGFSKETALMTALQGDREDVALFLIQRGADLFIRNRFKETALHIACRRGQTLIIQCMLSQTICPVDALDLEGDTPLHVAAARGFFPIVKLLLLSALKTSNAIINKYGKSPRDLAKEGGFTNIVTLIDARAA